MKCNRHSQIELFFNGELQGQELLAISNHLEQCEECHAYLEQLKEQKVFIEKLKVFKPELTNPAEFRDEILGRIGPKQRRNYIYGLSSLLDDLISLLVHPVTRYSFISAAVIIFGVFIYQQTTIVQKIESLEKRMEAKVSSEDAGVISRKNVDFFKKRSGKKAEDKEFNELLDDYRLLLLKHKVLIKVLKEKYPDTYREFLKELEMSDLPAENINI